MKVSWKGLNKFAVKGVESKEEAQTQADKFLMVEDIDGTALLTKVVVPKSVYEFRVIKTKI